MVPSFEDALGALISKYRENGTSVADILSAFEIQKMALEEEDGDE